MSTSVGTMVESILIKESLYYIDAFYKKKHCIVLRVFQCRRHVCKNVFQMIYS